ncbi:permease for cytosine/purines, uracil, thiamine, allantoin-domain-containing protein, partial [Rhodotorula diobovata]
SISSANDLASLFPKWVNIFRGQMFAVVVGVWAFAPWKVLASASSFISFMYSIVLAPLAAILCSDFFLVKKSKYNVVELYNFGGPTYRYFHGFNLAALAALLVSIPPNLPGMIHALNSDIEIGNAKYIYCMADIFAILVAGSVHVGVSRLFPDRASLIAEAVLAEDVLEGRVPGYEHLARREFQPQGSITPSEEKLDGEITVGQV